MHVKDTDIKLYKIPRLSMEFKYIENGLSSRREKG